jgi:hypothetical protein
MKEKTMNEENEEKTMKERQVVVTTSHRDVWTGLATDDGEGGTIVLTDARHVYYWDSETQGLSGLSSRGPGPQSRLGPPVARVRIRDVVTVADASPVATERLRSVGWGRG